MIKALSTYQFYKFLEESLPERNKKDSILEPLCVIFRLSLLQYKDKGTKLSVKNNSIQYLIITILACLLLAGLVLAGNRIPILFFLVTLIGLVIFEKNLRKFFIPFVLIAASFFYSISVPIDVSPLSKNMYYHLTSFKTKAFQIFDIFICINYITNDIHTN